MRLKNNTSRNNRRKSKHRIPSRLKRFTMANMPLGHKRRIVSTVHAVHGAIEGVRPIEECCHLLALMGARILTQCYSIHAEVVPCRARYIFDPVGKHGPTVLTFDERSSAAPEKKGNGIGHSIVVAASGDPTDDTPFLVDFQSPVLNKIIASFGTEFPYRPGLLWGRYGEKSLNNFYFEPSPGGQQFIQRLNASASHADIIRMAVSWYSRPPKKMPDLTFANAVPDKPETMRLGVLRYTPLVIEDNLHTPIEALGDCFVP